MLITDSAKNAVIEKIISTNLGKKTLYRLKDWGVKTKILVALYQ